MREPLAPAYEDDSVVIRWAPMNHTVPCLGYRLEERERPGKFNPERALALGVPKGSLWGKLQHGGTITLEGGGIVRPDQVLGKSRRGRCIAYITDSRENRNIYPLLQGADLAAIEGMFHSRESETARERGHLTAAEAGWLCSQAQVGRAILVHVSPRYENEGLTELEREARGVFPGAEMGRQFTTYTVPFPE
jgi:ribonuclease Z